MPTLHMADCPSTYPPGGTTPCELLRSNIAYVYLEAQCTWEDEDPFASRRCK